MDIPTKLFLINIIVASINFLIVRSALDDVSKAYKEVKDSGYFKALDIPSRYHLLLTFASLPAWVIYKIWVW